jgi:hypothetical protein
MVAGHSGLGEEGKRSPGGSRFIRREGMEGGRAEGERRGEDLVVKEGDGQLVMGTVGYRLVTLEKFSGSMPTWPKLVEDLHYWAGKDTI